MTAITTCHDPLCKSKGCDTHGYYQGTYGRRFNPTDNINNPAEMPSIPFNQKDLCSFISPIDSPTIQTRPKLTLDIAIFETEKRLKKSTDVTKNRLRERSNALKKLKDEGWEVQNHTGWWGNKHLRTGNLSQIDTLELINNKKQVMVLKLKSAIEIHNNNELVKHLNLCMNKQTKEVPLGIRVGEYNTKTIEKMPATDLRSIIDSGCNKYVGDTVINNSTLRGLNGLNNEAKYKANVKSWHAKLKKLTRDQTVASKISPESVFGKNISPLVKVFLEAPTIRSADGSWYIDEENGTINVSDPVGFNGSGMIEDWLEKTYKYSDPNIEMDHLDEKEKENIEKNKNNNINFMANWFFVSNTESVYKEIKKHGKLDKLIDVLDALKNVSSERHKKVVHDLKTLTKDKNNNQKLNEYLKQYIIENPADNLHTYDARSIHEFLKDAYFFSNKENSVERRTDILIKLKERLTNIHSGVLKALCSKEITTPEEKDLIESALTKEKMQSLENAVAAYPEFKPEDITYYIGPNKMPWHQVVRQFDADKYMKLAFSNHCSDSPLIITECNVPKAFIEFLFENKTESEPGTDLDINFYQLSFFQEKIADYNKIHPNQQLNEKETLLEILKMVKKVSVVLDQIGICCPSCSKDICPTPTLRNSIPVQQAMINGPLTTTEKSKDAINNVFERLEDVVKKIHNTIKSPEENKRKAQEQLKKRKDSVIEALDGLQEKKDNRSLIPIAQSIEYTMWLLDMVNAYNFPLPVKNSENNVQENWSENSTQGHLYHCIEYLTDHLIKKLNDQPNTSSDPYRFSMATTLQNTRTILQKNQRNTDKFKSLTSLHPKLNQTNSGDDVYIKNYRALTSIPKSNGINTEIDPKEAFTNIGPINLAFFSGHLGVGKSTIIQNLENKIGSNKLKKIANTETDSANFDTGDRKTDAFLVTANDAAIKELDKLPYLKRANESMAESTDEQSSGCACCAGLHVLAEKLRKFDRETHKEGLEHIIVDLVGIADDDVLDIFTHINFSRINIPHMFSNTVNLATEQWQDGQIDEYNKGIREILIAPLPTATHIIENTHHGKKPEKRQGEGFEKILKDKKVDVNKILKLNPESLDQLPNKVEELLVPLFSNPTQAVELLPDKCTNKDHFESEIMDGFKQIVYAIDPTNSADFQSDIERIMEEEDAIIDRAKANIFVNDEKIAFQIANRNIKKNLAPNSNTISENATTTSTATTEKERKKSVTEIMTWANKKKCECSDKNCNNCDE